MDSTKYFDISKCGEESRMKRKAVESLIIAAVIFTSLAISKIGFCFSPFTISVVANKEYVRAPQNVTYTLLIKNNLNRTVRLEVFIWSSNPDWFYITNPEVTVKPHSYVKDYLIISPSRGVPEGLYTFLIEVRDLNNPNISAEKLSSIYVEKSLKVDIKWLKTDKKFYKRGETVKIMAGIRNDGSDSTKGLKFYGLFEVFDQNHRLVFSRIVKTSPLDVGESEVLSTSFKLNPYKDCGNYLVVSKILDAINETISSANTTFRVACETILKESKTTEKKFLRRIIKITVENVGNKAGFVEVKEPKKYPLFLYSLANSPKIEKINGKEYFVWDVFLKPLQKTTIVYEVSFIPVLVTAIITLLILIWIYLYLHRLKAGKHHYKKGDVHNVVIKIKNDGNSEVRDVEVIDYVPGIFQIITDGCVGKPTEVRKRRGKKEIIWRFPKIAPGEEKVLSYKIKPLLEIEGKIELPNAIIKGRVGKRKVEIKTGKIKII